MRQVLTRVHREDLAELLGLREGLTIAMGCYELESHSFLFAVVGSELPERAPGATVAFLPLEYLQRDDVTRRSSTSRNPPRAPAPPGR